MTIHASYTKARANLGKLFDEVAYNQETVIINRRAKEDVALTSASELNSLKRPVYFVPAKCFKAFESISQGFVQFGISYRYRRAEK